ncbi:Cro/CI family transcriptional regulator [Aeromonas media]|uniref:Cro/CI family transcriptional regulator n=1 Tax=Aeromonas media TaxID=651 RepID=A0AAP6GFC2_AERME|nr:Cro/CI family transcriptional regulator [Aeromonas media]MDX7924074.1 Cro/CI family transcriptional regulator [Aeromonas media]
MKKSDAIEYYGTATALARALGINKSAVSLWGDTIPKGRAYQIEVMTGGQLKADPTQSRPAQ